MAKSINLKIVTPQAVVYEGTVSDFTVPGVLGPFQVLFNHAPIVSKLEAGLLRFRESSGSSTEERYFVSGGFLELHENSGTILADSVEHSTAINVAEAEAFIASIRKRYADHEEGYSHEQYHSELDAANARLAVAKNA